MRPSWDDVAIGCARLIAERSTCLRLHTAAVICTQDNRIVATGYNGSLPGQPHCDDILYMGDDSLPERYRGCEMDGNHCIRTIHAEMNAILQAAHEGIKLDGCKLYALHMPCAPCANAIVQAGIVEVIVANPYSTDRATQRLDASGVLIRTL